MAILSSHVLNGSDGTHASAIAIKLRNVDTNTTLIESSTDEGGRFSEAVELDDAERDHQYELIIATADYWQREGISSTEVIDEIVLRFKMHDPDARYHKPLIIAPNSYSTWSSVAE